MEFIYDRIKNKFIIRTFNQEEYEFDEFIENINQFIREMYLICFENEIERKFKLVKNNQEYFCNIVKLDNEFINLYIEDISIDINISIACFIIKIVNVVKEYFKFHSLVINEEFENELYQKLKNYISNNM